MQCAYRTEIEKLNLSIGSITTSEVSLNSISLRIAELIRKYLYFLIVAQKVPPFLDFVITWTALSNSFWNPFLYWLLNAHFRRLSRELILRKVSKSIQFGFSMQCTHSMTDRCISTRFSSYWLIFQCCFREQSSSEHKLQCCSVSSECDANPVPLPPPPASRPISKAMPPHTDFDTLSEKYWGEILERTVSSSSLQTLQRSCSEHNANENAIADSAAQQYHQFECFKCSVNDLSNGYHFQRHQPFMGGTLRPHANDKFIDKKSKALQPNHTNLANFSNSEPRLCDHYIHDINCAKNELYFKDEHSNKGPSNM